MKIFGIGANRTGTISMTRALSILGYRVSHWQDHESVYNESMNGNFRWGVMEKYDAILDLPVPSFFKELHREWGNEAKFIFTYRSLDGWMLSQQRHMATIQEDIPEVKLLYGEFHFNKDLWKKAYINLIGEVVSYNWSPGQFLMFSAEQGDGWKKLCDWLDKPIPGIPYPHLNRFTQPAMPKK